MIVEINEMGGKGLFGYVTPYKGELKVREFEEYRGVYCGLCKTIGKQYGQLPRMFLSYDYVFLSLLLQAAGQNQDNELKPCRCMLHPTQKRLICCQNNSLLYVSGVSVLLLYHKAQDNIQDGKWHKRLLYRGLRLLLTPAYRKAKKAHPQVEEAVLHSIERLNQVERARSDNMDEAADTFAELMEAVVTSGLEEGTQRRVAGELARHLGRWIYLMDALTDLEEDVEQGSYNPLFYRFAYQEQEGVAAFRQRIASTVDFTLVQSLSSMLMAWQLLPHCRLSGILENIICLGLRAKQQELIGKEGEETDGSL
ncbi:MAG: DUF5685 family protein [Eubacteriales bacterium]